MPCSFLLHCIDLSCKALWSSAASQRQENWIPYRQVVHMKCNVLGTVTCRDLEISKVNCPIASGDGRKRMGLQRKDVY